MSISSIDDRRRQAGITQKALCLKAQVHESTYSMIKLGRRGGYVMTLQKLSQALDALISEQERAEA